MVKKKVVPSKPVPSKSVPSKPVLSKPVPSKPVLSKPVPSKPLASKPLASKLRTAGPTRIARKGGPAPNVLFIVAMDQLRVYQHLEQEIAKLKNVELITDRRRKPRRQREVGIAVERRKEDRRKRPDVERQLRQLGWSLVRTVKIPPGPPS
jgi:hypothetical protein